MNILVIGSGGREHALCWKIAQSPLLETLYCTPGNGGIEKVATCLPLDASNHQAVIEFCRKHTIELVVVGPEQPLVEGLVDTLDVEGIKSFGPSAFAAQLEGSKGFTKDMCAKYNIPTAAYGRFNNADDAKAYVKAEGAPIVVKADGLAAGKGVIMAETLDQALDAIDDMFDGSFGEAGAEVVLEEWMIGEEASFFAITDGKTALALDTAQDHKRVGDGDVGLNTGGMGAYSPAPVMTQDLVDRTMSEIIEPTMRAMADMGHPYKGVLYAGLILTDAGPKLIEYNCRFGDPECQVLMSRITSDLVPVLLATAEERLEGQSLNWSSDVAMTVVMAANGYPGSYSKNTVISGIDQAETETGATVFHAGTKTDGDKLLAIGGRVLNVTATGGTATAARDTAYSTVSKINWPDGFYRNDIGWRAIAREQ